MSMIQRQSKGEKLYSRLKVKFLSIPVEFLIVLADEGHIPPSDIVLMSMIDSMTDSVTGVGCWASNRYLANLLGITKKQMEKRISTLRRLLFIKNGPKYKGNRTLLVNWKMFKRRLKRGTRTNAGRVPAPTRVNNKSITNVIDFNRDKGGTPRGDLAYWCCVMLKEAVHKNTRRICRWRINSQKKFMRSRFGSSKDTEHILNVLEWYCNNLTNIDQFHLPRCFSPADLANDKLWNWIEDRYEKHAPRQIEVDVSAEAETIFNSVKGLGWPKGSKEQLPKLIQLSLDEYSDFKKRMVRYYDKQAKNLDKNRNWLNYVQHTVLKFPGAYTMVSNWFRSLRQQIESWTNWQGDLYEHRLHISHKRFMAEGRRMTTAYGRPADDFNKLVATVYAK